MAAKKISRGTETRRRADLHMTRDQLSRNPKRNRTTNIEKCVNQNSGEEASRFLAIIACDQSQYRGEEDNNKSRWTQLWPQHNVHPTEKQRAQQDGNAQRPFPQHANAIFGKRREPSLKEAAGEDFLTNAGVDPDGNDNADG